MRLLISDLEYLLDRKELEEFKPANGLQSFYRRIILGSPYVGALEVFNIVTNSLRGYTSKLSIGNLESGDVEIKMENEVFLPNGDIINAPVFKYITMIDSINKAKKIFDAMDIKGIIEKGYADQADIDRCIAYCNQ
jgi:hypothetical protein